MKVGSRAEEECATHGDVGRVDVYHAVHTAEQVVHKVMGEAYHVKRWEDS